MQVPNLRESRGGIVVPIAAVAVLLSAVALAGSHWLTELGAAVTTHIVAAPSAETVAPARRTGPSVEPGALAGSNVVLITVDTLRADVLGAYGDGGQLTPNIDRLADAGVRFDNAFAHATMTLPSHASILTGQYPFAHGVRANGSFRLDASRETLAELLHEAGYRTAAFVGAFVLDYRFGLAQGFDHYDDFYGEQGSNEDFRFAERRAAEVIGPALDWISTQTSPWFTWVHLFDPHAPYAAPDDFMRGRRGEPYRGEVAYVDHQIGAFLDQLEEMGVLDDTLIIFTADHGESLGEHGEQTHGAFGYDATLRVPLVVWGGERLPAAAHAPVVGHVDIVPTVLELLGVAVPESVQGSALLGASSAPSRSLYFEALDGYFTQGLAPLTGLVDDEYKFIDLPLRELYHRSTDPGEQLNLAATEEARADRYRARLEERLGAVETSIEDSPALAGLIAAPAASLDAISRRRLESLGYVAASGSATARRFTAADDPKNALASIEKHRQATALFAAGRHQEAIFMLRELLDERPEFIAAYLHLASMLHAIGRPVEAIGVVEAARTRAPDDVAVAGKLGLYLALSGDTTRAIELLDVGLKVAPDDVELLEAMAIALASSGRQRDSRPFLDRALQIDPSSASVHHNLGLTYAQEGDQATAISHFERAIELAPEFWHPYEGLAGALAITGREVEAVEAWKRQVELHPGSVDAIYNLGLVLTRLGRDSEALVWLDRFAAQAPVTDPGVVRAQALAQEIRTRMRR